MTLRKRILFYLVLSLFTFVISGCGSLFHSRALSLAGSSNYSQLIREFEPPDKNFSKMPFSELIYLCSAYAGLKNYQNLFPCLNAAQTKVNAGECVADLWDYSSLPLRMKATAHIELGQYEEAIKAAEASYKIITDKKLERYDQIQTLEILGMAYGLAGMNHKAEAAIGNLKKILYSGSTGMLEDHINMALARIYITLNKYQEAINVLSYKFEDSNTFAKTITGWDVFMGYKIQFEFMKNKSFFEVGRMGEANEGYDNLLRYPFILNQGEVYWNILFDRGRIAEKEGDFKEAINFYTKAVDVIEQQRASINTEASKIGFVGDKQALYHNLVRVLYHDGRYEKAFEYVERSKSRALVDLLASNKEFGVLKNQEQVASMLKEIETIETEGKAFDVSSLAADKINERNTRSVQIKEKIKTIAPELSSLIAVSVPHSSEIQSYINNDETLVEYYYHGEDIYAFVLTKNELKAAKLDGKDLANDIEQFRKSLQDPKSTRYLDHSQKLYQRLIKPVEHFINTTKLIIVPHGILHYLPFNALNSGNSYLIDKYSVSYLPSSSIMKFLKQRKTQEAKNALIFGNPDLGDPKYDLKYAEEEAVTISKGFPRAKVLIRKEATKTAFKKFGSQFDYIHFATHGLFESDAPLNSGLFLAKDSENDGVLSVNELYSIRLNADLITLSACETALGKINSGDDVVGLTRGFLFAGSSSIVASLWKVDDMATAQLMTEFYSNLRKTNKRDALRDAQLNIKKQNEHPYFWAAFQLTGNAK